MCVNSSSLPWPQLFLLTYFSDESHSTHTVPFLLLGVTPEHALEKSSFSVLKLFFLFPKQPSCLLNYSDANKNRFFIPLHRWQNGYMDTGHLKKEIRYTQNKWWRKWLLEENVKIVNTMLFFLLGMELSVIFFSCFYWYLINIWLWKKKFYGTIPH